MILNFWKHRICNAITEGKINKIKASTNLFELIRDRSLQVYPDENLRLAILRSVAIETARGWRITKEKTGHKIDVVVALA
ncbi:hypothetical protein HKBW3S06_01155, partial [Candidatus Hakubella thermalkaliphila]